MSGSIFTVFCNCDTYTLILNDFLSDGKHPSPIIFIQCLLHYFHNAFILDHYSDKFHLPTLSTIDGVWDLMSLFAMAIFLNVQTYHFPSLSSMHNLNTVHQYYNIFDLNGVPIEEQHHACYIQGLAVNLINWFFNNYIVADANMEHQEICLLLCLLSHILVTKSSVTKKLL